MHRFVEGLTDAQREAVLHVEGPLLILAGPGSGKTRVITHRIARLLDHGIPGSQILALTFTNKAADEMRSRVERLVGEQSVWLGTFHRFCARMLRRHAPLVGLQENYTIYDVGDSMQALRRAIARSGVATSHVTPDAIAKAISWAKNRLITPQDYSARSGYDLGAIVQRVYPAYQAQLATSNAADFDDLLLHTATLLRENPELRRGLDGRYRFILVDEYQDTNLAQYAIVRALSIDHPNLAVTGDPDQSIYGWRGANLNNILDFEEDFPSVRVVRLERNYRSTERILRVAGELIRHNVRRKEKGLFTKNGAGTAARLINYLTQKDEVQDIARQMADAIHAGRRRPRDFAVFYRVNALSRAFEFALRDMGIPYQLVHGLEFFQRKEIKDVLAYLQLLNNPHDEAALLRVINTPARGIGKTTIGRLTDHAARRGSTLLEAARDCRRVETLSKRSAGLVTKFVELFDRLAAAAGGLVEEVLGHVLTETGYQKQFKDSPSEEDQQRLENTQELLTVAREFDERHVGDGHLEAFLEESSLVSDTDAWETEVDRVTLMTLHASKGLEFPVVYLAAVEEGLLPHERSRHDPDQLEEERRLMFVGITRAQDELQISHSRYRDFRGQRKMTVPSPFLMELPREEMQLDYATLAVGDPVPSEFAQVEPPSLKAQSVESQSMGPVLSRPKAAVPTSAMMGAGLTTAADLANGGKPAPSVSPDLFHQGMVVLHPEHGLGKIVALSGSGASRKATIDFASGAGRKKFVLSRSPLRPVKNGPGA